MQLVGSDKIVLDLSCRFRDGQYWVVTDRWQHFSQLTVDPSTMEYLANSCAEFLVHGVDVEGKRCGVDRDLIQLLKTSSPIPVTYAGGVKDLVRNPKLTMIELESGWPRSGGGWRWRCCWCDSWQCIRHLRWWFIISICRGVAQETQYLTDVEIDSNGPYLYRRICRRLGNVC